MRHQYALFSRLILLPLLTLLLAACGGSSGSSDRRPNFDGNVAVVTTAASDFSSGGIDLIDLDQAPGRAYGPYHSTASDISVVTHGRDYYLIERFQTDRINKVDIDQPALFTWRYSALEAGDEASSNPYTMIFASDDKAYLLRYGSTHAWIVDPTATHEDDFHIGSLDLSHYTPDGFDVPRMSSAVIVDDRLFITLQRLGGFGADDNPRPFDPANTSYVAVFDINTDEEIVTGHGEEGLPGIPLFTRNPEHITHHPDIGLLVQSIGNYGSNDLSGIDRIDADTYEATRLVEGSAELGAISGVALIDAETGFLVTYGGWMNNTLRRFNPVSGTVGDVVANIEAQHVTSLAVSPQQQLWVGLGLIVDNNRDDILAPGLYVMDPDADTTLRRINTSGNPIGVSFMQAPGIDEDSDDEVTP
ncbi:hypothetical protein [Isoalcanivorax indicus]|uniref:hypothetical protein n=1 Tax=Isoalcanivorax indicus TaxID=2202653 RepID=UPI000DBA5107|nr:hypothetical protein [Isoalcanivorax indicus]